MTAPEQAEMLALAEYLEAEAQDIYRRLGIALTRSQALLAADGLRLLAQQPAPQSAAEENRRLREALEWYAEPSIYQQEHFEGTGMEYPALVDGGHSARLALSAAEAPAGRDT